MLESLGLSECASVPSWRVQLSSMHTLFVYRIYTPANKKIKSRTWTRTRKTRKPVFFFKPVNPSFYWTGYVVDVDGLKVDFWVSENSTFSGFERKNKKIK